MTALRTRNALVLAKIEAQEGVEETPTPADNAFLVENPQIQFNPNIIETNEVTGSLDGFGPITGGMSATVSFDVFLKGSGAAGTAPAFSPLMRACGWAEQITATAIPASPEACDAGGSTTTAVLGAAASSTAQAYRGMPLVLSGTVSGTTFITDYTAGKVATLTDSFGAAIVATTDYQIPVNVLYKPASTAIPSLTFYVYMDGLLYKFTGARGTFSMTLEAGGAARLSYQFNAQVVSKTDVAVPAGAAYDSTRPPVWRSGKALIDRVAAAVSSMQLDNGAELINPPNPNAQEGFDPAIITRRRMTGSIDPNTTLVATRDIFSDFRNGTRKSMNFVYGAMAGNRVGITIPLAHYTAANPSDRSGVQTEAVSFEAAGADAGAFICLY